MNPCTTSLQQGVSLDLYNSSNQVGVPVDVRYLLGMSCPSSECPHILTLRTLSCTLLVCADLLTLDCAALVAASDNSLIEDMLLPEGATRRIFVYHSYLVLGKCNLRCMLQVLATQW